MNQIVSESFVNFQSLIIVCLHNLGKRCQVIYVYIFVCVCVCVWRFWINECAELNEEPQLVIEVWLVVGKSVVILTQHWVYM